MCVHVCACECACVHVCVGGWVYVYVSVRVRVYVCCVCACVCPQPSCSAFGACVTLTGLQLFGLLPSTAVLCHLPERVGHIGLSWIGVVLDPEPGSRSCCMVSLYAVQGWISRERCVHCVPHLRLGSPGSGGWGTAGRCTGNFCSWSLSPPYAPTQVASSAALCFCISQHA